MNKKVNLFEKETIQQQFVVLRIGTLHLLKIPLRSNLVVNLN